MEPIKLFSLATVAELAKNIENNFDRYRSGNFTDVSKESGWEIQTAIAQWNPSIATSLNTDRTSKAEIENSILVYQGMVGMTPALAREERLWARLCHVECLEYARKRWLKDKVDSKSLIASHFFASGLPGCRDDNAIGRLWWNGHVATLGCPEDIETGLTLLLNRANIRLQIIDRADTSFRKPLIQGIFRQIGADDWFDTYDAAVADFMFEVNKRSGGIMFEAMSPSKVDTHLAICLEHAKIRQYSEAKNKI